MEVRPYGDTLNDGAVQLSFTLPVSASPEAQEAAKQLVAAMGFQGVNVVSMSDLGKGFSFFVIYARTPAAIDFSAISVPKVSATQMTFYEINDYIKEKIGRKIVVVGACTGTDAHTVGLDAIMNMKGYAGEYGLERYPQIEAHNLGSQVPNETLVARAIELNADCILVSQVVTQKDVHIPNLTQLVESLEAEGLRDRIVLVVGGPRISHELAIELGYDAGFGPGTLPPQVATFISQEMSKRGL
ncbi:MAG TPA: OAM dimerization domain-containing protein [Bacillota bacterium]|nr:OAM dimerization domain-containing protein [Bacillota bacterium]